MLDLQRRDGAHRLGRHVARRLLGRVREDQRELLAAVARRHVPRPAARRAQRRGDLAQAFVAGRVAVGVVEGLEVVDVGEHEGDRSLLAPRAAQLAKEVQVEPAPVGEPGEAVLLRQAREPFVGLAQFQRDRHELAPHVVQPAHRADLGLEHHRAHGLGEVVVAARLDAAREVRVVLHRGEEDDRDPVLAAQLADAPHDLEAVQARHLHVDQHQVGLLALEELEGLQAVLGLHRLEPRRLRMRSVAKRSTRASSATRTLYMPRASRGQTTGRPSFSRSQPLITRYRYQMKSTV